MKTNLVATTLMAGALAVGAGLSSAAPASAQVYYQAPVRAHEVRGVVTSFYRYGMSIDSRGQNIPVQLHQGTIIEPLGASVQPGMRVVLFGYWTNGVFAANRIILR
jgi:hypothetical protein